MEITIKSEVENKALKRKKVTARIHYEGVTPSRKDVQAELAKQLKAKPELTIIRTIGNVFGNSASLVEAVVYDTVEEMKINERKNLIEKHAGHEPKKEEEADA
jgi:ribosomal protein S24E